MPVATKDEIAALVSGAMTYTMNCMKIIGLENQERYHQHLVVGLCVNWLRAMGVPAQFAAGGASFRLLSLEAQGDLMLEGKAPACEVYGYVFNEGGRYMDAVLAGELPEMYPWVQLLDSGMIFDPCIRWQNQLMEEAFNATNHGHTEMPEWVWDTPEALKARGYTYNGDRIASMLAFRKAVAFLQVRPLPHI